MFMCAYAYALFPRHSNQADINLLVPSNDDESEF